MSQKSVIIIFCSILAVAVAGYFLFPNLIKREEAVSQAKINIDEVCQDALTYTTFIDGASAELFVSECKEGKHPEVIEQYKARMGLGAGAEI